jgi:L-lactate utilization protein LutC
MNTVCQKTLDEILKVIDKRIEEHTASIAYMRSKQRYDDAAIEETRFSECVKVRSAIEDTMRKEQGNDA